MKLLRNLLVASLSALLLAGCGSGGNSSVADPAPTQAAINQQNQTQVAQAALSGALTFAGGQQILGAADRSTGLSSSAAGAGVGRGVVRDAARRTSAIIKTQRAAAAAGTRRALGIVTDTEPCAAGGSVTVTFNDANNDDELSAGETLTFDFDQCRDTASSSADGLLQFTIQTAAQDAAGNVTFSATASFQNLHVVEDGTTTTVNGSIGFSSAESAASTNVVLQIGSTALTIIATGGINDTVVYEANSSIEITEFDGPPAATEVEINGAIIVSSIGGRISVETIAPVRQLAADRYPSSGQLLITGANNARLRITVLNRTTVRLALDVNGDGTNEATADVLWSLLKP